MFPLLKTLINQFPAILITGQRQVGKSTLLQQLSGEYEYVTFDDPMLLDQARDEPSLFMLNHQGKLILDEVQYAPKIFSSLKFVIIKVTASPNKKMVKAFGILKDNLPPEEIQIGTGVIIN